MAIIDELIVRLKSVSDTSGSDKMEKSLARVKVAAVAAGAAIVGIGFKASAIFGDFEAQMTQVEGLLESNAFDSVGQNFEDGLKDMTKRARMLISEVPAELSDVTKSLFDVISAGIDAGEAMGTVEAGAKLALAGGVEDMSVAIDGITTSILSFKEEQGNAQVISEKFFAAQKMGKTTIEGLSNAFSKAAPLASSLGLSLDETLSSISAITLTGASASEATTRFNGILKALLKPSKEASGVFDKYGIEVGAAAIKNNGFTETLMDILKVTKGNPDILSKMFPDVEGLSGAISLLGNQNEAYLDTLELLNNEERRAALYSKAYNDALDDQNAKRDKAKGSIKGYGVMIGLYLSPIVKGFYDLVTATFRLLQSFDWTARIVAYLGAAIASISAIGGAIVLIKSFATVLIGVLIPAIASTIAAILPFIPWIALLATIGLLIEDIWVYLQGGDSVIGRVIDKLKEMGGAFESFGELIEDIAQNGAIATLIKTLENVWALLSKEITFGEFIKNQFQIIIDMAQPLLGVIDKISSGFAKLGNISLNPFGGGYRVNQNNQNTQDEPSYTDSKYGIKPTDKPKTLSYIDSKYGIKAIQDSYTTPQSSLVQGETKNIDTTINRTVNNQISVTSNNNITTTDPIVAGGQASQKTGEDVLAAVNSAASAFEGE